MRRREWNKCHRVPCTGGTIAPLPNYSDDVRVAALEPSQRSVSTIAISAPVPMRLPGAAPVAEADAAPLAVATAALGDIMPLSKTPALLLATRGALPLDGETALGAITDSVVAPPPTPRALLTPREPPIVTAYAPEATSDPARAARPAATDRARDRCRSPAPPTSPGSTPGTCAAAPPAAAMASTPPTTSST